MSTFIDPFAFLLGPLLYLYIRSHINKDRGVSLADFIHFFPTIILLLGYVYFFVFDYNAYSNFILMARKSLGFPLENFTFVFSSLGDIRSVEIKNQLDCITGNTKTQTIFLHMSILNDKISLEVSASNYLFDSNEVFVIFDEVYCQLL